MNFKIKTGLIALLLALTGCYTIMSIDQPDKASTGEKIYVHLQVRTEPDPQYGLDTDPKNQIVGLMIPNDWVVDSVYFQGNQITPAEDYCTYLPPDSADAYPSKVDYWTDSLEAHFPSGPDRHWVVYQSVNTILPNADTTFNDLYVNFTVGQMEGTFGIGYFVSNAALDFDEDYYYSVSLDNEIIITNASAIKNPKIIPNDIYLSQNYPNPFNPNTIINYNLNVKSIIRLSVFNINGKEVAVLVDGLKNPGEHSVRFKPDGLPSGIYFYTLTDGTRKLTRKMIYIR